MQEVSQEYINSMKKITRNRNTIDITLSIENLLFNSTAELSDNNSLGGISDTPLINKPKKYKVTERYPVCELNYTGLNQELYPMPDDLDYITFQGYVSNDLSDAECEFTNNPIITVVADQSKVYNLYGIILKFDSIIESFATEYVVRGYDGENKVYETTFNNTQTESVAILGYDNINKLEIEFIKVNTPFTRLRVSNLFIGIRKYYNEDNILQATQSWYAHPISNEMSQNKFEFVADNMDNDYDPENPMGLSKYLMERQRVEVEYGYELSKDNIEKIKGGVLYINGNPKVEDIQATFTAYGLYHFMNIPYRNGLYLENGVSYGNLLEQLFEYCNLPKDEENRNMYRIDQSLYTKICKIPLPVTNCNELVKMICNATGMIVYEDRDGYINIEPNHTNLSDFEVTSDDTLSYPVVEYVSQVKNVNVKVYTLKDTGETKELIRTQMNINGTTTVFIEYDLSYDQDATILGEVGTQLVSANYYAYGCELTITSVGAVEITVTGIKVERQSKSVTYFTQNIEGEDCDIDNKLVSDSDLAMELAERTYNYLTKRKKYEVEFIGDVRLDANDIIKIDNQFATELQVRVIEHQLSFGAGISGTIKMKQE